MTIQLHEPDRKHNETSCKPFRVILTTNCQTKATMCHIYLYLLLTPLQSTEI